MLWRRAILGAVAIVLPVLLVQLSRVSTSAEDKIEAPASSESQAETPDEPPANEETIEIPLGEIWAYNMPGTKKVGELAKQEPRLMKVIRSLWKPAPKGRPAKTAFAVQGTGLEALRNCYEVLVDKYEAKQSFDPETEISVVFFSHADRWYVHLESVERKTNIVTINYKMISHETEDTSEHFALIPLGKLPSGKYEVDTVPIHLNSTGEPSPRPPGDEIVNRIVSRSFSFTVKEGK